MDRPDHAILRGSKNLKDAKACLMEGDISRINFRVPGFEEDAKQLHFTEKQATAILEMRLYKLIGLEILALEKEYRETLRKIKEYQHILKNRDTMNQGDHGRSGCDQGRICHDPYDGYRGWQRSSIRGSTRGSAGSGILLWIGLVIANCWISLLMSGIWRPWKVNTRMWCVV